MHRRRFPLISLQNSAVVAGGSSNEESIAVVHQINTPFVKVAASVVASGIVIATQCADGFIDHVLHLPICRVEVKLVWQRSTARLGIGRFNIGLSTTSFSHLFTE